MSQSTRRSRLFLGMTIFQWGVLSLLGLLNCGVIGLLGYLVFNVASGNGVPGFDFTNPANALVGRWEKFILPTPTPTLGATPTPIAIRDYSGNIRYVTPPPQNSIRIGCDFVYPPTLEFFKDGTYAGTSVSVWSGIFILQGGQYEVLDRNRIKIQTKNGFSVFQFTIEGDKLKFIDDSNCELVYSKIK